MAKIYDNYIWISLILFAKDSPSHQITCILYPSTLQKVLFVVSLKKKNFLYKLKTEIQKNTQRQIYGLMNYTKAKHFYNPHHQTERTLPPVYYRPNPITTSSVLPDPYF